MAKGYSESGNESMNFDLVQLGCAYFIARGES